MTDWAWCYENPKEAAAEIDRLYVVYRAAVQYLEQFPDSEGFKMETALRNAVEAYRDKK